MGCDFRKKILVVATVLNFFCAEVRSPLRTIATYFEFSPFGADRLYALDGATCYDSRAW